LVNAKGTDWAADLPAIEFAFNSTVHATGVSPFWAGDIFSLMQTQLLPRGSLSTVM
jgi:hypothetical protein